MDGGGCSVDDSNLQDWLMKHGCVSTAASSAAEPFRSASIFNECLLKRSFYDVEMSGMLVMLCNNGNIQCHGSFPVCFMMSQLRIIA